MKAANKIARPTHICTDVCLPGSRKLPKKRATDPTEIPNKGAAMYIKAFSTNHAKTAATTASPMETLLRMSKLQHPFIVEGKSTLTISRL